MKKSLVIALVIGIVCIGAVGFYLIWKQKPLNTLSERVVVPTNQIQELVLWEDQAGFLFKYPKELSFDKHDEDQDNYAHIEFKSATHSGRLIVWAKDTTYPNVGVWVTKDPALTNTASVDTRLGGIPAKKIIVSISSKKIVVGAISDQILFTVESEPAENDPYWTNLLDTIVSSFTFTSADTSAAGTTSSEDAAPAVDEEEVVE
jgi:hypothetical protein